jgi:UDP-N-acetylmuramoylalanine--D-glutamate ligase
MGKGSSMPGKIALKLDKNILKKINLPDNIIVVTGSNGKTTFVSMLNYLLNKAKLKCITCGNSFSPITKHYKKFDKLDYLIIEQSSFQLHNLALYNPYISIILNLHPNHLDSSYSLNSYYENKKNIYNHIKLAFTLSAYGCVRNISL